MIALATLLIVLTVSLLLAVGGVVVNSRTTSQGLPGMPSPRVYCTPCALEGRPSSFPDDTALYAHLLREHRRADPLR